MAVLQTLVESHRAFGVEICHSLIDKAVELGFLIDQFNTLPQFDSAEFAVQKDPFTMDENLMGTWYNENRHKIGQIQFLSDGSFYAEYDVIKPHPTKKRWFVEAVTAWGKPEHITAEPKLLPIAE